MSSVQAVFNGPFKRADLLLLPQYAASLAFTESGKWTGSKNHLLSTIDDDAGSTTQPLYCIVVGVISDDRSYLGNHGNFCTKFGEDASKAKLQFTLTRPHDPDFGPDYDNTVTAFDKLQSAISVMPRQSYFLLKDQSNAMQMSYALFKTKGDSKDEERERESQEYTVSSDYEAYWDSAKATYYCCVMPVFDTNDAPIKPKHFADKLIGAMCEVTFTLRHYAIGGKEPYDVFSAHVESVAILKNPPMLVPSLTKAD